MGNSKSKTIKTVHWLSLPTEVWVTIIEQTRTVNDESVEFYDVPTILKLMSTCKTLYKLTSNLYIWKGLCQKFQDFDRLERMYKTGIMDSWKHLYQMRICGTYKTVLLKIGDRRMLVELKGNGNCFVSKKTEAKLVYNYVLGGPSIINTSDCNKCGMRNHYDTFKDGIKFHMIPLNSIMSPVLEGAKDDGVLKWIPFTKEYKRQSLIKNFDNLSIIDIQSYEPTVAILSQGGRVFEWIFIPDYIDNFYKHIFPVEVIFPPKTKIVRIFCTAASSYAISSCGKLFVWTIFDHPESMKKIRTVPLHLTILDKFDIKNIVQESDEHTIIHTSTEPLIIENSQIYYLIFTHVFGEEKMLEMSKRMNLG